MSETLGTLADYIPDDRSCVYAITNTATGEQYVGSTHRLRKRLFAHRSRLMRHKHYCASMQKAADNYGLGSLRIEVLETVQDTSILIERERHYVALLNPAYNSGRAPHRVGAGHTFSAATRAKMSASRVGKKATPEALARMSAAHRGKPKSPEHVAKVVAAITGRPVSAETRAHQSAAQKRRFANQAEKARNAEVLRRARAIRYGHDLEAGNE